MTTHQIGALVAPPADRIERVMNWLSGVGVPRSSASLSLHKDFVSVSLTVEQAEALLKTEFHTFESETSGKLVSRALEYHIPVALENDIDFIGGVLRFPQPKDKSIASVIQRAQKDPKFAAIESDLRMSSVRARASTSGASVSDDKLASNNSPIISYTHIGDGEFTLFFLPLCSGSNAPATSFGSGGNGLSCSGNSIYYANLQPESVSSFTEFSFNFGISNQTMWKDIYCGVAGKFSAYPGTQVALNAVLSKNNFGSNSIFCAIHHKAANFHTLNLQLSLYGNNNVKLGSAAVPSITPAPYVTPHSLKSFYNLAQSTINTYPNNSQSVSEFLGEYYSPKDLTIFFDQMGMLNWPVDQVIGPNDPTKPGGEASLDIQVILGISNNLTTWFWSYGELHDGQEPFLQWLIDMSNKESVPYVHSTSYADEESTLSRSYMDRVNTELAKQGVRGVTLLFSSGDDGLGGYTMRTNPGICAQRGAMPEFPATSPYVTSVGGTQFSDRYLPLCASYNSPIDGFNYPCDGVGEVVSSSATGSRITSGGGFSINYPRQPWQEEAVQAYFKYANANGLLSGMPTYNPNGRAFPDVSGIAHNYVVIIDGKIVPVDGTSASTPFFASILALANDLRLGNNAAPVGFVTPALYQIAANTPDAFNDVVYGTNACSAFADKCCSKGFDATPGWDPSSGLGTPDADKLIMYLNYLGVPRSK